MEEDFLIPKYAARARQNHRFEVHVPGDPEMTSGRSHHFLMRTQLVVSIVGGLIFYIVARFIFDSPDAGSMAVAGILVLFTAFILEYVWKKVRGVLRKR
jgi:hypothetical protein